MDLAIGPFDPVPARFATRDLADEDFVIVARDGHPFARAPNLESYCAAGHVVVSQTGDAQGFVDVALADLGRARRVALTVPGFFMALVVVAATDLLAAVPRRFVATCRADLTVIEPPLTLPHFVQRAVLPKGALADAGLAWLLATVSETTW